MAISPEKILKLKQLGIIILYWGIMLRVMVILSFLGVAMIPEGIWATKFIQIMRDSFWASTGAGFAIGLSTGIAELYFFPKHFKNGTLLGLVLRKIIIYLISVLFISVIAAFVYGKTKGLTNADSLVEVGRLLNSNGFYYILSVTFMLSIGLNFYLIVQNKIGINNFFPVISGKYYYPREENRIFLFLDLKSSSIMAEQLGHEKYSKMLQACYRNLSDLVLRHSGNIYQFVGDEAVITWEVKSKSDFRNSINLFFAFTENLMRNAEYFKNEFGVVPEFKGTINAGQVMAAEVGGYLKSEIAYHGDVLNTAARMLELAKSFPNKLIVSRTVKENLPAENGFKITSQGKMKLRGKNNTKDIYLISEKSGENITEKIAS